MHVFPSAWSKWEHRVVFVVVVVVVGLSLILFSPLERRLHKVTDFGLPTTGLLGLDGAYRVAHASLRTRQKGTTSGTFSTSSQAKSASSLSV